MELRAALLLAFLGLITACAQGQQVDKLGPPGLERPQASSIKKPLSATSQVLSSKGEAAPLGDKARWISLSLDDLSNRRQQLASLALNDWSLEQFGERWTSRDVCAASQDCGTPPSGPHPILAQAGGEEEEKSEAPAQGVGLAKASQEFNNPISKFTLFITENDTLFLDGDISNKTRVTNVTVIEPIIPAPLGNTGWTLVNRPILPIGIGADIPVAGSSGTGSGASDEIDVDFNNESGLGDLTFFSLLTPPSNGSKLLWGFGPTLRFPTATDSDLGAEKYSAGPAAIALFSDEKFTLGVLNQNFFSYAGDDDRDDVRASTFQYFAFYNFAPEWGVGTAPIVSVNWEADDDDDKLLFPVGLGVTHTFRIGKAPARILLEGQYYAVQRDTFGPEWNIRVALGVFLPSLFGQ